MEWPTAHLLSSAEYEGILSSEDEAYLEYITTTLITKQIYARAAKATIANILVDHDSTGLRARVEAFLEHLRSSDDDQWSTEYRHIAREFTELMASARPRSRTLEICRAGLDAVHELLKYRLPKENGNDTLLSAKDAFILCQSFENLETQSVTGTRAPDIDFRFGLLTKSPKPDEFADSHEFTLHGKDACDTVSELRNNGQVETSAASLACHTLMNTDLVGKLALKTFVVIGCDHPLSPTQSLLKIPGVTVLGIPSSRRGLEQVLQYATYNNPDDTTFVYPTISKKSGGDDGNLILSRGPHVAQWILEQTKEAYSESQNPTLDPEIVLVPMPLPIIPGQPRETAVRWEVSSDLIVQRVLRARSDSMKCSVWSYQSSTTCMVVPSESKTKSTELLQNRPLHERYLHGLSLGTLLTPVMDEENKETPDVEGIESPNKPVDPNASHYYSIVNAILDLEGPHHVLAEHIRIWRAMVTNFPDEYYQYYDEDDRDDDDSDDVDDSNKNIHVFAPHVPLLSPGLVSSEDAHILDPLRVFEAGPASSLLCAISLAGLVDPIINRPLPIFEDVNDNTIEPPTPFAMFWNGSVHGGIWNCPYTLNSVSGTTGYLLGKVYSYYHYYNSSFASQEEEEKSTLENDNHASKNPNNTSRESIVDVVPSSTNQNQELPDIVQQRLEMMANA
eukprot:CAMPEP_0116143366 /NCGR_PEP_ID=MMETSP0329-20121206/15411_1 /TAXON_ID=697910 /ORGANISM="Pseudo-nitzschia arenysensis, Strain B593" /LENGTH=675 /DNA_ID=CAMNT_0003638679 /DNA_START=154 /DNA_END=2181 /DNA_ORIENTATION=-